MSRAPNLNHLATRTLVGALADLGVQHAVITPGSRNTPVAWQIAEESRIETTIHHDERSASFFAVGIGKATGAPAVLSCTSGTAAAEYLPAVVEAHHARTPLIVLTADRPPELRNVGAPQAIDQHQLYGSAVRWFHDPGVPELNERYLAATVATAVETWRRSTEAPPGPVHLNLPFRDPLAPEPEALPPIMIPETPLQAEQPEPVDATALGRVQALLDSQRTLVVAGPGTIPAALLQLAERHGWPVIADPLANLRGRSRVAYEYGNAVARLGLLDGYLQPEAVLRVGANPTSKALMQWLEKRKDVPQVLVHDGLWRVPDGVTIEMRAGLASFADGFSTAPADEAWMARWRAVRATIASSWQSLPLLSEPWLARFVAGLQEPDDDLWVASSMPVRDLDDFGGEIGGRVLGHRGANGIDGLLSAALGSARATGRRTRALIGDLTMLHDLTAVAAGVRLGVTLDVVVVDNNGGGIFHFLPQVDYPIHFEKLLGTPHGFDLSAIAAAMGAESATVRSDTELTRRLWNDPTGMRITVVPTDRHTNVDVHRDLWDRLEKAFA